MVVQASQDISALKNMAGETATKFSSIASSFLADLQDRIRWEYALYSSLEFREQLKERCKLRYHRGKSVNVSTYAVPSVSDSEGGTQALTLCGIVMDIWSVLQGDKCLVAYSRVAS